MTRLRTRPLRVKITVLMIVLLSVGLGLSSFIATTALSNFLVQRVDESMQMSSRPMSQLPPRLPPVGAVDPGEFRPPSRFFIEVVNLDGRAPEVIATPDAPVAVVPDIPAAAELSGREGVPFTVGSVDGTQEWRVIVTATADGWVVLATSLADVQATVARLVLLQLIVGTVVVVVAASIGYVLVRRSLKPLADMSDLAHEIAAGDLSLRVPESGTSTEIDQLAGSFNVMVTRIEESFEAQRLSEMQARESEEQARESEERMRQFVADASHELRTPLTTIRGFAELAGEGATQPGTALSRIEDEAIRMGVLVNDLLLLARLDQQRPLEVAPVNALDVVTASVAGARVGAPERSIDVIVSEDHGPPIVLADEQRLRQVLDNLLVNALKHSSPASDVSVAVRTVRTGDGDGVEIAVTNSAPGMSAEVAERVFDRFYQSDPARSRVVGGSGLGLSIATAIVEAHGGRISLDTSVEGGTTFTVSLPCAPASPVQGGR